LIQTGGPVRLAAKQKLHRPRIAPALGLRAGWMSLHCIADHDQEQMMTHLLSPWSRIFRRANSARCRKRPSRKKALRRRASLQLEFLEDRSLLSAYLVTTTADSGPGSLRDAITQINADTNHTLYASPSNPTVDEIDFAVTAASDAAGGGTGFSTLTGVATITPQSGLPGITNAVFIDGYSQPGSSGNTNPFGQGDNAVLKVELNGSAAGGANGLGISSPNSTVRGLVINRFASAGIGVGGASSGNDWIYGNFIGVDPTGLVNEANEIGVWIDPSNNVTVGSKSDGHDALERNLISGIPSIDNNGDGIRVGNAQGVSIRGNYLGTDATGNSAFTSAQYLNSDIRAYNDTSLSIVGNVISGGAYFGMDLYPNVDHATIQGNRIGTNAAGTAALGNTYGIYMIYNIHDIQIGGTAPGSGNLISGNPGNGVIVASQDCFNITAQGNFIGTDVTGTYAVPNGDDGFAATGTNLLIGGTVPGAGNLISGNGRNGISIAETAGPVLIQGNTVGTDATGTYAIGNGGGINVSASGVTIGGADTNAPGAALAGAGNLISGNTNGGVGVGNGNLLEGNYIGTDKSGLTALPNGFGVTTGASLIESNLISGNGALGGVWNPSNSTLQDNLIGTDVTGNRALPNQGPGINLGGGDSGNQIGTPGHGNVISGNAGGGIYMQYYQDANNFVQGNFIGTNAAGNSIVGMDNKPLGNVQFGILDYEGPNNTFGGSAPGAGNVIAGNQGPGVIIGNSTSVGNVVQGNFIGTDVTGILHLGNTDAGVYMYASNNAIGGTTAGSGNIIAFNGQDGVFVFQGNAISILGNSIHDNGGLGIDLNSARGANNNQAAPVLSGASVSNTGITVSGTLNSVASTTFRLEFFSNIAPDPTGYGEGLTFLGSYQVTTDTSGNASFNATGLAQVPPGQGYITATATNLTTGDTSQFSNDLPRLATSTTVTSSANPSILGQSVTLTATVSGGTATGTVQFQIDASNFGSPISLSGGSASISTALSVGPHTITAIYGGDAIFLGSTGNLTQNVDYAFSGFLPPLNQNIAFGLNRTIPIKFQLSSSTGSLATSLSAVSSLQIQALDSHGSPVGAPFNPTPSGGTALRNDGSQYVFNWQTKGLAAGSYEIVLKLSDGTMQTKVIQLSANGSGGALLVDGTTNATTAVGALLGGNIDLYVDNSNGDLTADELARIQDAVTAVDAVTVPYGVTITEVTDPTQADVTLNMDTTSAVGGYANGVLGCTTDSGQVTIIAGWNFYAGSNVTQIGAGQYDFETVVTHELGHALGLGHSANSASVMFATLNTGEVNRGMTVADLNVADSDNGACGLHASPASSQPIDFSFAPDAGFATSTGSFQPALNSVSADGRQAGLNAFLGHWSATDFSAVAVRLLDNGQSQSNHSAPGTVDNLDDFWSSIADSTMLQLIPA
jgi:hypothetical protein